MPYWILSRDGKGKSGLAGPYTSSTRAQQLIDEHYEVQAEVVMLPTNNPARATRLLKEGYIEEKGFVEGTKRFTHPKV